MKRNRHFRRLSSLLAYSLFRVQRFFFFRLFGSRNTDCRKMLLCRVRNYADGGFPRRLRRASIVERHVRTRTFCFARSNPRDADDAITKRVQTNTTCNLRKMSSHGSFTYGFNRARINDLYVSARVGTIFPLVVRKQCSWRNGSLRFYATRNSTSGITLQCAREHAKPLAKKTRRKKVLTRPILIGLGLCRKLLCETIIHFSFLGRRVGRYLPRWNLNYGI